MEEERRLCYVGITRAQDRLFLSFAVQRMLFNLMQHNRPSRFLDEIPQRLLDGSALRAPSSRSTASQRGRFEDDEPARERPQLRIGRQPVKDFAGGRSGELNIPGVRKGFLPSQAQAFAKPAVFKPGDRVQHKKFGQGDVVKVTGSGSDARISIEFAAYGVKEFSLSIAPIIKVGD